MFDVTLRTPANHIVAGPSSSGKSSGIVYNLLKYKSVMFESEPGHVVYFFSDKQPLFDRMHAEKLVDKFVNAPPDVDELARYLAKYKSVGSICVVDDFLDMSAAIVKLFTQIGHHANANIIFTSQSLFLQSKDYRTISLNCHYLWVTKNPRDSAQIHHLARQVSPYRLKYIIESFYDATRAPYSYALFDFHQRATPFRLRTHVFPSQFPMRCYLEREAV